MEEKILSWLSKHGFPLEMRVAQKMTERSFHVTQSAYFNDFETGTPREIDLLSRLYAFYEPAKELAISEVEIFCAVECKASASPWVVFRQTEASSWSTDRCISSKVGKSLVQKASKALRGSSMEVLGKRAGYGAREAFAENDRAFSALMSAIKASEATIRGADQIEELIREEGDDLINVYSAIAFPVVLISAPLFECTLDDSGHPKLEAANLSSVVLRYPRAREGAAQGVVVYIVTEAALPIFMDGVFEYLQLLKPSLGAVLPTNK
jgi:hypothetical protein